MDNLLLLVTNKTFLSFSQLALVFAAIWYAIETRLYRKNNELHLALLDRQLVSSNTPYVLLDEINMPEKEITVKNHSKVIATDVHSAFYDPKNDNWRYSIGGISPLKENEKNVLYLDSGEKDLSNVLDHFTMWSYSKIHLSLNLFIKIRPTLYIFFRNLSGHHFMIYIEYMTNESGELVPSRPTLIYFKQSQDIRKRGFIPRFKFWAQRKHDYHQLRRKTKLKQRLTK